MVIKQDFYFWPANGNRSLHIYLPDGYDQTDERYPVMYFFDGHNLFYDEDATYGKCWGLRDFLDQWDKKVIIVGMECSHEGNDRLSEYLPYKPFRNFWGAQPKGDETFRWIVDEVKPYIDRTFRTYGHREATAIGGSSMGGIMALYGVVHYNHVFSKAACVSSAIGLCMPALMNDMRDSYIAPDTKAFLSWGTLEAKGVKNPNQIDSSSYTYRSNRAAYNKFMDHGAMAQLWCQVGGSHCEADWEKQVPIFMNYLWKGII